MANRLKFFTIAKLVLLAFALLFGVLVFRAEVYFPRPSLEESCHEIHTPISGDDIVERFRAALRFKTVTFDVQDYAKDELKKFAAFLEKSFPRVYRSPLVTFEVVDNYSLLFHVKGSDPTLTPYLLTAHSDVVPVEEAKWDFDPFAAEIKDGFIYGRGTIDCKHTLMSIFESLDYLLRKEFKPRRSFYIGLGHDEEGQGIDGAPALAKALDKKGVKKLEFLFDEGVIIIRSAFPGVNTYTALIGVTEKGYISLNVRATGPVGHSSMAPQETAITTLAKAISKFTGDCHPDLFGQGPERDMFEAIAPYAAYPYKLLYSNFWIFRSLMANLLARKPTSNTYVRTTTAVTIINGGFKENVLPSEATAVVNHRIHPTQTIEDIIEFNKRLVNDDRIEFSIKGHHVPTHPISPFGPDAFGYQTIKKSVLQVFSDTIVVPAVMFATTDTKSYLRFTDSVYRFSPVIIETEQDSKRFHGHNERISIDNYLKIVNFYHHIMINADEKELKRPPVKDEL